MATIRRGKVTLRMNQAALRSYAMGGGGMDELLAEQAERVADQVRAEAPADLPHYPTSLSTEVTSSTALGINMASDDYNVGPRHVGVVKSDDPNALLVEGLYHPMLRGMTALVGANKSWRANAFKPLRNA